MSWFLRIAALLSLPGFAAAQAVDVGNVSHWAIAPFGGTGYYDISDTRSIFVIAATPRWTIRETPDDWQNDRRPGIELLIPLSIGLNSFNLDDIPGLVEFNNFATLSVVPGTYVTLPMNRRWTLRALANAGAGFRLDGEENAFTYRAGLRSRYRFNEGDVRWSLINALEYVGYDTNTGRRSQVMPFLTGVELEHPLGRMRWNDGPVDLVWHLKATSFLKGLRLNLGVEGDLLVDGEAELGVAIRPETGFRIFGLKLERFGVAYRRSVDAEAPLGNGDTSYEAYRFYVHSLFDQ